MSNLVAVTVVGERPFFNGSLIYPGQTTTIDLDDYVIEDEEGKRTEQKVGEGKLSNLALAGDDQAVVVQVPIAPVAPHAPNPTAAQGWPAGGKPSGSGEMVFPDGQGGAFTAVPADGSEDDEAAQARREQRDASIEAGAKVNERRERDALDHDGDGRRGGSRRGAESTRARGAANKADANKAEE